MPTSGRGAPAAWRCLDLLPSLRTSLDLETQIIDASTTTATATTATRSGRIVDVRHDERRDQQRDEVHHLADQRFSAGPAVSLNGPPTVSPITAAL